MERRGMTAIDAALRREREAYATIGVRPLSPVIGAEIEGLDLSQPLSAREVAELRRAYLEHHVLVFRDQPVTDAEHLRIAGLLDFLPEPGRRRVTLPAGDAAGGPEPVMLGASWRADETYRCTPPAGGILHIHKVPPLGAGGDMMFSNMHLAYDLLSEPLKALLADMSAVHAPEPGVGVRPGDASTTATHPVVTRHPVTGRPTLFVNRRHTSHIVQLGPAQSRTTLGMLCRHLETHPVLTCRIRWTQNALVVWDNRSTQHLTLQDFRPSSLSGHLVSLAGRKPERWEP
jgi:taurine dioxygenase